MFFLLLFQKQVQMLFSKNGFVPNEEANGVCRLVFLMAGCQRQQHVKMIYRQVPPSSYVCHSYFKTIAATQPYLEPDSLLEYNLNGGFESNMARLQQMIHGLPAYQKIGKVMLLTDFVYAASSFEFLEGMGYSPLLPNKAQLQAMPLRQLFDKANGNQFALDCGMRTNFLLKLIDSIYLLPYFVVQVPSKHVFAVVNTGTEAQAYWVIADAYDPFVVIDEQKKVLDFFSLLQGIKGTAHRSHRAFGPSRQLVHPHILQYANPRGQNFLAAIGMFNTINQSLLAQNKKDLTQYYALNFNDAKKLLPSTPYSYAIPEYHRPDTFLFSNIFDPQTSSYFNASAIAFVPPQFANNKQVVQAAKRLNAHTQSITRH